MQTTSQILKLLKDEGIHISRQALNLFKKKYLVKERDYLDDSATTIYTVSGVKQILEYYKSRYSNS